MGRVLMISVIVLLSSTCVVAGDEDESSAGACAVYEDEFQAAQLLAIDGFSAGSIPIGWWYSATRVEGEWEYVSLTPQSGQSHVVYRYPEDGGSGWLHLQMSKATDLSDFDGLQLQLRTDQPTTLALEIHTSCTDDDDWTGAGLNARIPVRFEGVSVRVPFTAFSVQDETQDLPSQSPETANVECVRAVSYTHLTLPTN